jgi:hypothetical protein
MPRSASGNVTGLDVIDEPRSAWIVSVRERFPATHIDKQFGRLASVALPIRSTGSRRRLRLRQHQDLQPDGRDRIVVAMVRDPRGLRATA